MKVCAMCAPSCLFFFLFNEELQMKVWEAQNLKFIKYVNTQILVHIIHLRSCIYLSMYLFIYVIVH